jgi:hypothetical protein
MRCSPTGKSWAERLTSVDDIPLVKVVHSTQHLPDCLRSILLCEFAALANPIKQLTTSGQLSDNVKFVLIHRQTAIGE